MAKKDEKLKIIKESVIKKHMEAVIIAVSLIIGTAFFVVFLAVAVLAVAIESGLTKKILALIKKVFPEKKENIFEDLPDWVDKNKFEKMLKEMETGSKIGDIHGWNRLSGESKKRGW